MKDRDARTAILGLSRDQLAERIGPLLEAARERSYRLRQIRDWVYRRTPDSFSAMDNLPKAVREQLASHFILHPLALTSRLVSKDGTEKFLWSLERGTGHESIESVMIPDDDRVTYCISSQAGCPVNCSFCATGHGGFRGQLGASDIVDQVVRMRSITARAPTNIVYMGMGEPLLNFDPVCRSLEILTSPDQVSLSSRRITVSTVGIPRRIRELGERYPQVNLALSLHAGRDALRDELVPMNQKHPLRETLAALRERAAITNRTVTIEYVILPGVNDQARDIDELVGCLKGIPATINLIGFNPYPGATYKKPAVPHLVRFRDRLTAKFPGAVTLRRSRGADIQGACGQLRLGDT